MSDMQKYKALTSVILAGLLLAGCQDLGPALEKVRPVLDEVEAAIQQGTGRDETITTQQMVGAIKQALNQGVDDSISLLGAAQGFQLSQLYHIDLPQELKQPAELLRQFGLGSKVDSFEQRLNQAASVAVRQAGPVFTDAIAGMSVRDALGILQGADNAATVYFRAKTEGSLRQQFLPIIARSTEQARVTQAYKSLNSSLQLVVPGNEYTIDIDQYVMDHALDALFDRIGVEEKLIREQPVKRTTELMQKVFGRFDKG